MTFINGGDASRGSQRLTRDVVAPAPRAQRARALNRGLSGSGLGLGPPQDPSTYTQEQLLAIKESQDRADLAQKASVVAAEKLKMEQMKAAFELAERREAERAAAYPGAARAADEAEAMAAQAKAAWVAAPSAANQTALTAAQSRAQALRSAAINLEGPAEKLVRAEQDADRAEAAAIKAEAAYQTILKVQTASAQTKATVQMQATSAAASANQLRAIAEAMKLPVAEQGKAREQALAVLNAQMAHLTVVMNTAAQAKAVLDGDVAQATQYAMMRASAQAAQARAESEAEAKAQSEAQRTALEKARAQMAESDRQVQAQIAAAQDQALAVAKSRQEFALTLLKSQADIQAKAQAAEQEAVRQQAVLQEKALALAEAQRMASIAEDESRAADADRQVKLAQAQVAAAQVSAQAATQVAAQTSAQAAAVKTGSGGAAIYVAGAMIGLGIVYALYSSKKGGKS